MLAVQKMRTKLGSGLALGRIPDELFDVVDRYDRVIGTETRALVHQKKLLHRAVHVFVFNQAGQLFLQRRSMKKDSAPGKWVSSCSGHVDSGEEYDCAAKRELAEEIGSFEPRNMRRVFKEDACRETGWEFVWLYACESEGPFTLDAEEVSDGRWIDHVSLEAWLAESPRDFAWSFVYLWSKFRELESTS